MNAALFVCVHNAGRSQMAEAFFNKISAERGLDLRAESAGTVGGKSINPLAAEAMREIGVPMDGQGPKILTSQMVKESERVITMGCGVDAEVCPARFILTDDWGLDDPAGQAIERVREIRDEIRGRVVSLVDELSR